MEFANQQEAIADDVIGIERRAKSRGTIEIVVSSGSGIDGTQVTSGAGPQTQVDHLAAVEVALIQKADLTKDLSTAEEDRPWYALNDVNRPIDRRLTNVGTVMESGVSGPSCQEGIPRLVIEEERPDEAHLVIASKGSKKTNNIIFADRSIVV
jgi:hypothetical protein